MVIRVYTVSEKALKIAVSILTKIAPSRWTLRPSDGRVADNFDMTLTPLQKGRFNLTGTIAQSNGDFVDLNQNFTLDMAVCNSSRETKTFKILFIGDEMPVDINSNSTMATVDTTFDAQTSNFTLSGSFLGLPLKLQNATTEAEPGAYGPDTVRGKIKISFRGVIDPYHSDILVDTSSTPAWVRTVGFGNNSLNIGYGQSESRGSRASRHSVIWLPLVTALILFSGQLSS